LFAPVHTIAATVLCGCIAALPQTVQSQTATEYQPVNIPANRIGLVGIKSLRGTQKFIMPTVLLYVTTEGVAKSSAQSVGITKSVTSEYHVLGIHKSFAEGLAARVQSSFAASFTAAGMSLQLFDDISAIAAVANIPRLSADSQYSAPVSVRKFPKAKYVVVAPTDAQLFAGAELKKHIAFKALARETGATVVIPELWFQTPKYAQLPGFSDRMSALMLMEPGVDLLRASLTFITPDGESGSLTYMVPVQVGNAVGDLKLAGEETARFSNSYSRYLGFFLDNGGENSNSFTTNRISLIVSEPDLAASVVRGAMAFLNASLVVIDRERRR
jgi:hypothetical protein